MRIGSMPSLHAKIIPAKVRWLNICGNVRSDMRTPTLGISFPPRTRPSAETAVRRGPGPKALEPQVAAPGAGELQRGDGQLGGRLRSCVEAPTCETFPRLRERDSCAPSSLCHLTRLRKLAPLATPIEPPPFSHPLLPLAYGGSGAGGAPQVRREADGRLGGQACQGASRGNRLSNPTRLKQVFFKVANHVANCKDP